MEILLLLAFVLALAFFFEWVLRQLKIDDYESRYVLITGCDSGFGHELARKLDKLNFNVFACCLTHTAVEKFNETSSPKLKAIEMDVSKDVSIEKAMEIVNRTLPSGKGLWAVVNNAGILGGIGSIKLHTRQDYENTLAVNLYGVIMVTKACMPLVLKEKGRVVNISSVSGRIAFLNSSYAISKYGVEAFSDALRRELYRTGVKVQIIEPGAFTTSIFLETPWRLAEQKAAGLNLEAEVLSQLPDDALAQLTRPFEMIKQTGSSKLHQVVDAYCHAITAKFPKKRYQVGNDAKYVYRLLWNLPECISDFYIDWLGANSI
ncbi:17-beta-hydroxysteroid dehydrogenase type 6-like [Mercenaria mercenaria]|uniref:17-beta-hydroxysteroid dehydrogenase type 6-like n=1 Tax=Mercenaria mercenaria TaxID=6596 RepID=UPI00234EC651|nr:17-beta-hydroxysteroid dehydrogenase type 6-like [Mercenaria mercenaria]